MTSHSPSSRLRTVLGLVLAALTVGFRGVTFVNTKALLEQFSALEIQVLRFALAYAALWAVCPQAKKTTRSDEAVFVLMGLMGVAVSGWKKG